MPLQPGTTLGPYEIQAPLGAGGMGEVYEARDTRLDRTVAIKVLPEHVAADPDLKQRFEREAKTVAALSHPHICPVFDVGSQDGIDFLVMEYLDGETLAQRLEKGALPLDQALQIAIQIADALDKAHRQRIVHRDLKPGNIMLTKAGAKLLDFGLAKLKPVGGEVGVTGLPTQSAGLTGAGTILGTLQHMAPETLEGKDADVRTDIFAFGTVVYEMVTGQKAFEGESQASLIGAILKDEPQPMSAVQRLSPSSLDRVVRKCLAKDPEDRWHSAHDLRDEVRWIAEGGSLSSAVTPAAGSPWRLWLTWGTAAVFAALVLGVTVLYLDQSPIDNITPRFSVPTERGTVIGLALSPDGRQLAFTTGIFPTATQLWVRALDSMEARPVPGTEGALDPFWSADGRAIGFFTINELKTIDLAGGPPRALSAANVASAGGATWNEDDVIVFGSPTGLLRVAATGGEPTQVTSVDAARGEVGHAWPQFLPDGEQLLFVATSRSGQEQDLYLTSLEPEAPPSLLLPTTARARYATPGYLLFHSGSGLMAQPFDADARAVTGDGVRVVDEVFSSEESGGPLFSTSDRGGLAYVGAGGSALTQLRWVDRSGADLGAISDPGDYEDPVLSPDERRIAVEKDEDIWILDASRGGEVRFTLNPGFDGNPVWSPDGDRIVFTSMRAGGDGLYEKDLLEARPPRLLLERSGVNPPYAWSADGAFVSVSVLSPDTSYDILLLPMSGDHQPTIFLQTPYYEGLGMSSPDGRWMAYSSEESGDRQIYIQPFPEPGGQWAISTEGGREPRWRGDGKELYYLSAAREVMAVDIDIDTAEDTPVVGIPHRLFAPALSSKGQRNVFDVTADGQRFLVNTLAEGEVPARITWVLNWTAELEP